MMPDMDGFSLCNTIRRKYKFPIIFVTAKVEDIDKINGLSIGADDYVTKPFQPLELVARVKAQLRRYKNYNEKEEKNEIDFRGIRINNDTREFYFNEKKIELTKGKPLKLIFLFALPLMLGNILQQLYTMVDTMIVGQFLGVNALASLGAADWINWAILGIVMGFTQGFSIRISRTFGAEDYENMKRSMHMIFFLCAFFSILTTVVAELSIVPLLTLLNTPSNVIQGSITYLRIMSGGLTITMFYNCFSSILRSLGDSRTPLLAMIGGAITNICLDLLFVVVFNWGIAGAAIATLLAQFLTAIFCLYMLKKELPFKLELAKFKFEKKIIKNLLQLGSPLAFQNLIISIGGIMVQSVVNRFGFLFIAGFTATNKLYGLLEVAAISFGYAITTFNSQNLGAIQYERIKKGVAQAAFLSFCTSVIIGGSMVLFGKHILLLFISGTPDQINKVLTISYKYLFIMAICLPILYMLHSYRSALQGMENTFIPMVSGIVELVIRVGVALIFPIFLGQNGIYLAEVLAWTGAAVLLYISYKIKIHALLKGNSEMA